MSRARTAAAVPPARKSSLDEQGGVESIGSHANRLTSITASLAPWFRPAPSRPLSRLSMATGAAALVAGVAAALSRTRGPGALNTIWIEDASNFLQDALNKPFLTPVYTPFSGYYHVGPRLMAEAASLLPIRWTAPGLTTMAALMLAAFALVVYVASAGHLPNRWVRLLVAVPVVAVPVGYTQANVDVATLQFPALYAMFWILLWLPAHRTGTVVAALGAAYVTVSSLLPVLFLPLALARLVAVRTRATLVVVGAYFAGLAVQGYGQLRGAASTRGFDSSGFELPRTIKEYLVLVVPRSILGERWLGGSGTGLDGLPIGFDIPHRHETAALVGIAWLIVVVAVAVGAFGVTRPRWALAGLAAGYSFGLYLFCVYGNGVYQPRYLIAPVLLLYTVMAALLHPRARSATPAVGWAARIDPPLPAVVFAVILAVTCIANFRVDNGRSQSPPWDASVRAARAACAVPGTTSYPRAYRWYLVSIPCRRLR